MSRRGFTLIEMVIVIGVLLILLALLLPAVGKARDQANSTTCASHVRVLTQAFITYAADHDGHLPADRWNVWTDSNPDHWDWLFGVYGIYEWTGAGAAANQAATGGTGAPDAIEQRLTTAPQSGTIWKYVNDYQVYLCPSLTAGKTESGVGSNGRFDYAAFTIFEGALLKDIPQMAKLHFPTDPTSESGSYPILSSSQAADDGQYYPESGNNGWNWSTHVIDVPTPIVCQEDPGGYINYNLEAAHDWPDRISHDHFGGSWIGTVDGSVAFVVEPDIDLYDSNNEGAHLWSLKTRKHGTTVRLDHRTGWGRFTSLINN